MTLDPALLDFIDALCDIPDDDASWLHLAQLLAERDELEAATFVRQSYDILRRLLTASFGDIPSVRKEAKRHSDYSVLLVDCLTPRLRRRQVEALRLVTGPPPLPRSVRGG